MSIPPTPQIICTPQQLHEVEQYLRALESALHRAKQDVERIRNARTLRLARSLRGALRQPLRSIGDIWRILRHPAPQPKNSSVKRRGFALFRSPAFVPATVPGMSFFSVAAEIFDHCARRPLVTLHGIGPVRADADCPDVTPEDFEIRLQGLFHPVLLIDLNEQRPDSAWTGVFDVDDMRLNMSMAALLELVRFKGGRIVFAAVHPRRQPPLFADFTDGAAVRPSLADFDPDAENEA